MGNTTKIILAVVVVIILAGGGLFLFKNRNTGHKSNTPEVSSGNTTSTASSQSGSGSGGDSGNGSIVWQQGTHGWQASGTPPSCANPLVIDSPTDLTSVTAILYPGQVRGGNYKPHGGFRFDNNKSSAVTVTVPDDGAVVEASRYLVDGETQYMFDIMSPCGIMYRLGHLLVLTPKFQTIADTLPAPKENDSRTQYIQPQVSVSKGDQIATSVGVTKGGLNVFFDFGVYDYRAKNEASANTTWAADPNHDPSLAQHAICWLNYLPSADSTLVKSLPAGDPTSGKSSDFCK